ncbi:MULTISPECIES: bifunctional glycoside hydrolase 114/ polysaccharide deacetylase family protein [unclassified Acidovorax]|uniref:bifunctional glycoside hydrolase 114/ polysaccharide deacetylase family protein n=1 Tax=unclassified Acidovorax TaxID=2684926 RepID=UPI0028832688|nr:MULTISPECIES: bifunctional glycoside hydrolase 114/ polysaccharide deacetylase family protein [unclassified Acidovorax]
MALHYGVGAPLSELKVFDITVVEPDHGQDPVGFRKTTGSELFAYVSVAEVQSTRNYYGQIPAAWKLARNGAWNSEVIDQTPTDWPAFFADKVVAPLWARGYRGFFLDTLDSYRLADKFDEAAQQQGLVRVIETLHSRFPGIRLIQNRGFEIVPRVKDKLFMVAAESLFNGWNATEKRYEEVKPADREWLLGQLRTVHDAHGLPVLAIDYVPPHDRDATRQTAEKIKALGFIPWVTDSDLQTVGIGSVELMPRRVLMVYYGGESPSLNYSIAHRFLQMPLNHMGYVVDYADVREPLPKGVLRDRYAGIVISFAGFIPEAEGRTTSRWIQARMEEGTPLAVIGSFGMLAEDALADRLGIQSSADTVRGALRVARQHPMMGFEIAPRPPVQPFSPVYLSADASKKARPLIEFVNQRNEASVGGALMPWGGFILDPYALVDVPGTEYFRWVVDPFAFLSQALSLPALPVPDVTTENGRRLFFSHVDGDGFPSRAELPGSPIAARVLLKEIFEKYRVPQTMSVIEAEVAPHGLHPEMSAELEDIARRMFRLPHVEVASHTYSHPFLWDRTVKHGVFDDSGEAAINLNLPGYTMDLRREIVGSSDYINRRLAPAGKPVKILLWSGDTAPSAEALAVTQEAGLLNLNGGDTSITRANPSLTAIGAHGIHKNGRLQVYAPITNENIYTNLWRGPFYGFERVIESFEMTEKPRRIKPVDIYYHVYSASKRAGLNALHKVYRWSQGQPLHPVFASEFIRKVQDFHGYAIARDGDGWRVRGEGYLRTLRLPLSLGTPAMQASQNVAGYNMGVEGPYVHLSSGRAWLKTTPADTVEAASGRQPYLQEANARLDNWKVQDAGRQTDFDFKGFDPVEFVLADTDGCQVQANGRALAPNRRRSTDSAFPTAFYRLQDAAAHIQILCPAR